MEFNLLLSSFLDNKLSKFLLSKDVLLSFNDPFLTKVKEFFIFSIQLFLTS